MQPPCDATVYAVDAGGSRTVVSVTSPGRRPRTWSRESFAVASAGEAAASASLLALLREVREVVAAAGDSAVRTGTVVGCVASSCVPVGDEAPLPRGLLDVVVAHAPRGRLVVVNDVLPRLWTAPLDGVGVVVCSGTGSSVVGRNQSKVLIKVGGHEHILSDQGSAYSLAREGLRAAAADVDGAGSPTKLRALAEEFFSMPLPALGRWLAELPRARTIVASFAPCVTSSAEDGDRVATRIVAAEAAGLVDCVQAAVTRLAFHGLPRIALTGGVLRGSPSFRRMVEHELTRHGLADADLSDVHQLDGIEASVQYAHRLLDPVGIPEGLVIDVG